MLELKPSCADVAMYLNRHHCFLLFFFTYVSAFSQLVDWPSAPKRIVWLAADHASFGNGKTNELPLDVSTAGKLDKALHKLSLELGVYGEGVVLRFLSGS